MKKSRPLDADHVRALKDWSASLTLDPLVAAVDFNTLDRIEELLLIQLELLYPGVTEQMHEIWVGQNVEAVHQALCATSKGD